MSQCHSLSAVVLFMFRANPKPCRLLNDHLIRRDAIALRLLSFTRSFTGCDNGFSLTGLGDEDESVSWALLSSR